MTQKQHVALTILQRECVLLPWPAEEKQLTRTHYAYLTADYEEIGTE